MSTIIKANGFTNETLEWKAWLDVIDVAQATPEQIAILEESHPKAKSSDYYRFLAHQPEILRQRSTAYNAIMYAPGGLPRVGLPALDDVGEESLSAGGGLVEPLVSKVPGCLGRQGGRWNGAPPRV